MATTTLKVPKAAGKEITISVAGGDPVTFPVVNGEIKVPDDGPRSGDLTAAETALAVIAGAELAEDAPKTREA